MERNHQELSLQVVQEKIFQGTHLETRCFEDTSRGASLLRRICMAAAELDFDFDPTRPGTDEDGDESDS